MRLRVKEPFNAFSHLFGVLLAIPGLVWLLSESQGDPSRTAAFSVYGGSLILLYAASTLYHLLPVSPRAEKWFGRFDHIAIYLLIAGTYTPVCLVTLRDDRGWAVFGIVWAVALVGTIIKLLPREVPRPLQAAIYVAMGWVAIVAVGPLVETLPPAGLAWLLAGGLLYTAGAVVYGIRRPDPLPASFGFHGIFHLFVLGGSATHFVFMLHYVA